MACVYPTKASVPIHAKGAVCISGEQECAGCPLLHGKAVTILIYTATCFILGEVPHPDHLSLDDILLLIDDIALPDKIVYRSRSSHGLPYFIYNAEERKCITINYSWTNSAS